jgi:hypothetical protein
MFIRTSAALLAVALTTGVVHAQGGRNSTPPGKTFKAAELMFEYPTRDWEVLSGAGTVLGTLTTRRFDALIVVDRAKLDPPLAADEITELFAELEGDRIKEQVPGASGVTAALTTHPVLGKVVRVEFTRPAAAGTERVRQLTVPAGSYIYRIVCSARTADFSKHEATFERVMTSAKVAMPATTGGAW